MTAAMKLNGPQRIPGLTPWLCEYDGMDGRYAIVLHASDPGQILEDFSERLFGLVVLGEYAGFAK